MVHVFSLYFCTLLTTLFFLQFITLQDYTVHINSFAFHSFNFISMFLLSFKGKGPYSNLFRV